MEEVKNKIIEVNLCDKYQKTVPIAKRYFLIREIFNTSNLSASEIEMLYNNCLCPIIQNRCNGIVFNIKSNDKK